MDEAANTGYFLRFNLPEQRLEFGKVGGYRDWYVDHMPELDRPLEIRTDEPTTALDVTIQAQVLDVFKRVRARTSCTVVLITHDLAVVAAVADRVAVMYAGRLVELADVETLFYRSRHPYTRALLASLPAPSDPGTRLQIAGIDGHPPSPTALPAGCAFHPRCRLAQLPEPCANSAPELRTVGAPGQVSACHRAEESAALVPLTHSSAARRSPGGDTVLDVRDLVKHFPSPWGLFRRRAGDVHAVCGVSFTLARGETLGLVGESGCGKSTTARMVLNLLPATSGSVLLGGQDVLAARAKELRALRRRLQIVFQDPYASLNPRVPVGRIISGPLRVHGMYGPRGPARVAELMELTGLNPADADRYPHELSGGQRQRVGIARALATDPEVLVLDEPVSALDVSVGAGIVNLLEDLQARLGMAYLFIAHDLSRLRHIADRIAVMYLGRIVEIGTVAELYARPAHPYTQALLSAVPLPDPRTERERRPILLTGDVPDATDPPSGCRFRTRCWKATELCTEQTPALIERAQGHRAACHFPES
jgi:peptide/nickel transport system ATP-binding protein